jgi:hypothetical protein
VAKEAQKRLKLISDEVGAVLVFVDLGKIGNQRADVSRFCPLQTGVETASSASSLQISLTSKARLEEKRASILAAAEERKGLGDRVFEVAGRFAQLDKANCRFVENALSCAVAPLPAHAFPETSCTRFARLSSFPSNSVIQHSRPVVVDISNTLLCQSCHKIRQNKHARA